MKKLMLFILVFLLVLTSCEAQQKTLNTENGAYSVDLISIERAGHLGGYDFDTTILGLCEIRFDYGHMYTLVDGNITPVPELGFLYENNFSFYTEVEGNVLMIGLEEWVITETPFAIELTRTTNYNGMGMHIHTMRINEILE